MKWIALVSCLFLGWGICGAQSGEKNFIDQNYIEVTGTAEMEIVPDEIYLKIVLSEKDKGKKSLEEMEKEMLSILKKAGIDVRKDLLIKDLSSDFKSYFLKRTAIQTEKEYQLCLHGADKVGTLLVELEKAGISNISVDRVDHSQLEKFRREVKVNAVKAAKEKADAFAEAVGQKAGRALYIGESGGGYYSRAAVNASFMTDSGMAEGAPVLDFEKIPLKHSVVVRFELK